MQINIEATLKDQLDEALERIRQLEEELRGSVEAWPADWGITNQQRTLMAALMRHDMVNKESFHFSLYGHRNNPPGIKIIDVLICKLRKRLNDIGITIHTLWGKGYFISPEDKAFIREMMRFGPTVPRFIQRSEEAR